MENNVKELDINGCKVVLSGNMNLSIVDSKIIISGENKESKIVWRIIPFPAPEDRKLINAIKEVRTALNSGLGESKSFVEGTISDQLDAGMIFALSKLTSEQVCILSRQLRLCGYTLTPW